MNTGGEGSALNDDLEDLKVEDREAYADLAHLNGSANSDALRPLAEPLLGSSSSSSSSPSSAAAGPPPPRWRALAHLVACTVLGMCTWFSAGAVLPQLCALWGVDASQGSLLTIGVNLGFLCGALASTLTRLPDRFPPPRLMGAGSGAAAVLNLLLLIPGVGFPFAIALRFLTGASMALVYPLACKVVCTWFVEERGVAMAAVIGAVVLGSAAPHLVNAACSIQWQTLVVVCSGMSSAGAVWDLVFLQVGPHALPAAPRARPPPALQPKRRFTDDAAQVLRSPEFCLATLAYCGHNWELYAMWQCFRQYCLDEGYGAELLPADPARGGSFLAFLVVGVGFFGSLVGGLLADRWGRSAVCLVSLVSSGAVSMIVTQVTSLPLVLTLSCYWGVTIVSDSAQYSAMVTELADPSLVGTAVTIQFGIGYLFTVPGMYLIPAVADTDGWLWAWRVCAPGPLVGIAALLLLRRYPGCT